MKVKKKLISLFYILVLFLQIINPVFKNNKDKVYNAETNYSYDNGSSSDLLYSCDFETGNNLYNDTIFYDYKHFLNKKSGYTENNAISGNRSYLFVSKDNLEWTQTFDITPSKMNFVVNESYLFKMKIRTKNLMEIYFGFDAMSSATAFSLNLENKKFNDKNNATINIVNDYYEISMYVNCNKKVSVFTPLLVSIKNTDAAGELMIDDFQIYKYNEDSILYEYKYSENQNDSILSYTNPNIEFLSSPIIGESSAKVTVNASDGDYTGQFMNVNEGKVGTYFMAGHKYEVSMKLKTNNIKALLLRSPLLLNESSAVYILKYYPETEVIDPETNISNVDIKTYENYQQLTYTLDVKSLGGWTPILFEAHVNDVAKAGELLLDDFVITDLTANVEVCNEDFEGIASLRDDTVLFNFDNAAFTKIAKEKFTDINTPIIGESSAKVMVNASDGDYTGQFMNVNEGKVGSYFMAGHKYEVSMKLKTNNIKALLLRSPLLLNESSAVYILKYYPETEVIDPETNISNVDIKTYENYQQLTYTLDVKSLGGWTPILFEAHVNDVAKAGELLLDDFVITDLTANVEVCNEDFEGITSLRDDTVLFNFDNAAFTKIAKEKFTDINTPIIGESSAKVMVNASDGDYTGQFMNVNEGKVGSYFMAGHKYEVSMKLKTNNIKALLLRSPLLLNESSAVYILKYYPETEVIDPETNISNVDIKTYENYQQLTYTLDVKSLGGWTPILFEAHVNDVAKAGELLLDDFVITDLTANVEVCNEDFEEITSLRDDTVLFNFDNAAFYKIEKGKYVGFEYELDKAFDGSENILYLNDKSYFNNNNNEYDIHINLSGENINSFVFNLKGFDSKQIKIDYNTLSYSGIEDEKIQVKTENGWLNIKIKLQVIDIDSLDFGISVESSKESILKINNFKISQKNELNSCSCIKYESSNIEKEVSKNDVIFTNSTNNDGLYANLKYVYYYYFSYSEIESIYIDLFNITLNLSENFENENISYENKKTISVLKILSDNTPFTVITNQNGKVTLKEKFIVQHNQFADESLLRGKMVYSQNFDDVTNNVSYGQDINADDGIVGSLTHSNDKVLNGKGSAYGGYNYRKEGLTWAKLFSIDNGFEIKSDTNYLVSFKYKIEKDTFMSAGDFYFIFNSENTSNDKYFGFNGKGNSSFKKGVSKFIIEEKEGYNNAYVWLKTDENIEYYNFLFGIHLGGEIIVDDLFIYENPIILTPQGECYKEQINKQQTYTANFDDKDEYSLRSGTYFTSSYNGNEIVIRNNSKDNWAEGITFNYEFTENSMYEVKIEYIASESSNFYCLLKNENIPEEYHCYLMISNGKVNPNYVNGIFDIKINKKDEYIMEVSFIFMTNNYDEYNLILGIYSQGTTNVSNVEIYSYK